MFKRKFYLYSVPVAVRRAHVSVHEKVRQVRRKSCIICFVGIGCCGRGGGCRFLSACCRREILSCCAYVKISCGDSKWKVTQLLPVTVSLPYRVWSAAWHILFPCARLYFRVYLKKFSYYAGYKSQFGEHSETMYLKLSAAGREAGRAVRREDFSNMIWWRV